MSGSINSTRLLIVQAGDGAVVVVYSGQGNAPKFCTASTTHVSWGAVTTWDYGKHWSHNPDSSWIFDAHNYSFCVLSGVVGQGGNPSFNVGIRDFGFVRDGRGRYYAAVHDTKATIRLFQSNDDGIHWREYCPSQIGLDPAGPGGLNKQTSNWLQTGFVCQRAMLDVSDVGSEFHDNLSLAWPTLAVDGDVWSNSRVPRLDRYRNRLVLSYLESNTRLGGASHTAADSAFSTMVETTTDTLSPRDGTLKSSDAMQPAIPNTDGTVGVSVGTATFSQHVPALGDYMGIAVAQATADCTFGVNSAGNVDYTCAGAGTFGNTSTFFPFWPQIVLDGAGNPSTQIGDKAATPSDP